VIVLGSSTIPRYKQVKDAERLAEEEGVEIPGPVSIIIGRILIKSLFTLEYRVNGYAWIVLWQDPLCIVTIPQTISLV